MGWLGPLCKSKAHLIVFFRAFSLILFFWLSLSSCSPPHHRHRPEGLRLCQGLRLVTGVLHLHPYDFLLVSMVCKFYLAFQSHQLSLVFGSILFFFAHKLPKDSTVDLEQLDQPAVKTTQISGDALGRCFSWHRSAGEPMGVIDPCSTVPWEAMGSSVSWWKKSGEKTTWDGAKNPVNNAIFDIYHINCCSISSINSISPLEVRKKSSTHKVFQGEGYVMVIVFQEGVISKFETTQKKVCNLENKQKRKNCFFLPMNPKVTLVFFSTTSGNVVFTGCTKVDLKIHRENLIFNQLPSSKERKCCPLGA